ncbi:MAG: rhodanese-like domain-containing protein [Reichenbachiella sp.]|uniref:rhodanese-like domain-containing protein n=1 Tax=Reichenbachiella sp. TaxID=2184521 RepID=UPI0032972114
MRNVLIISLLLLFNVACIAQVAEKLPPEQFKSQIEKETNTYKILDLRTDEEVEQGMVPTAEQLNFYGEDFEELLGQLDKKTTYYIYCRSGGRSGKTFATMKSLGFDNVYELDGGMNAWKSAGLETE